ncbi:3-hydroxyacyl-ACP dehydratase FabZ family protein [Streptomyces cellulosae]
MSRTATVFDALDRPPRVEKTSEGVRVTVRLAVDRAAAQMAGHYPGFPIMPGVLLVDCVRQAAVLAGGAELRLRSVDRARFSHPLFPGDEFELSLLVTPGEDGRVAVRARGTRDDGLTAADLSVTLEPVAGHA